MIGLDTSAIIDLFKGHEKVKIILEQNKETYAVTLMNYLELFFGLNMKDSRHEQEAGYYRDFFKKVHVFSLTSESCEEASRILWTLKNFSMTS